jgi:hypothetical protein
MSHVRYVACSGTVGGDRMGRQRRSVGQRSVGWGKSLCSVPKTRGVGRIVSSLVVGRSSSAFIRLSHPSVPQPSPVTRHPSRLPGAQRAKARNHTTQLPFHFSPSVLISLPKVTGYQNQKSTKQTNQKENQNQNTYLLGKITGLFLFLVGLVGECICPTNGAT